MRRTALIVLGAPVLLGVLALLGDPRGRPRFVVAVDAAVDTPRVVEGDEVLTALTDQPHR